MGRRSGLCPSRFSLFTARLSATARGFPDPASWCDPDPGEPRPLSVRQGLPAANQEPSPSVPTKRLPGCQTPKPTDRPPALTATRNNNTGRLHTQASAGRTRLSDCS